MRVGIAADHRGFELKKELITAFQNDGIELIDFGASTNNSDDDYPDYVFPLARAVSSGAIDRGIAICGSGVGASIAANKIKNVRAALVHDLFSARQGVEHDDMNIICMGAQLVTFPFAIELIQTFLNAKFSGKLRHLRRLAKITQIEKIEMLNETDC
ncbi:MAG: RpiB/LacA/LacB family sugar-phosphate isomerase [Bacteriovorax sp.]|nr:RpiB/LacA/LacB family sugar-phosphate isomerase [Bacteriovorax sp.]